ncbi:N-acetylglucosamine-1-phosphate uridyltransferase / Glucosamine-1-phosphate N-acetyltransferase [hydrothermal vent metagenome]|uniref:UDP-N-acetylglucosamine diphosphorylase n=1 Tax=hydrothermal vent metagenome TaxID=652676 RepID=A0A3B1E0Y1_9ZZZZ
MKCGLVMPERVMAKPTEQTEKGQRLSPAPVALVMAAGKGTRMQSDLPKVVHEVAGRPMVCHVVEACLAAGCARVVAIVGYKQELVREALAGFGDRVGFAVQAEQLGTGHAVQCAAEALAGLGAETPILVLAGDGPLIRAETLSALLRLHRGAADGRGADATLATSVIEDPTGYGRIVRGADGRFAAIIEQKNASPEQLHICEVNPSYYCFRLGALQEALAKVERDAVSGEYYITDVPTILLKSGGCVEVIDAVPAEDVLSINTLEQLAEVDRILRGRLAEVEGVSR